MAEAGRLGEHALPEEEADPAEAGEGEDEDGRGGAPGVVADGGLVDDEDGEDGGGEDEERAWVVEAAEGDADEELVVLGPEDEEEEAGDESAGRTASAVRTTHFVTRKRTGKCTTYFIQNT